MDTFKERVRAVRHALGYTQQAFADKLGVKRNTIAKYEYEDNRNPEGPVIALICREFGVSREWLLRGEGQMFAPTRELILTEASREYGLDRMDETILRLYLSMGQDGRTKLRRAALDLVKAVLETPELLDLYRKEKGLDDKPLTDEERARMVAEYENLLKGEQTLERKLEEERLSQENDCANSGPLSEAS